MGDELQGKPSLHIFFKRLRHSQFCGPFAVVALVFCKDAGTVDAGGKLLAIHFLHGLELEKTRARIVGGNDVFCELRVGAGGRAERRFNRFPKQRELFTAPLYERLLHAKHGAVRITLGKEPVHQLWEGDRVHAFAHGEYLLVVSKAMRGSAVEPLPKRTAYLQRAGVYGFFVRAGQHAVPHQNFTCAHGGFALAARHAEEDVAVDVF